MCRGIVIRKCWYGGGCCQKIADVFYWWSPKVYGGSFLHLQMTHLTKWEFDSIHTIGWNSFWRHILPFFMRTCFHKMFFNRGDTIQYWTRTNYGALLHSSMSTMDKTIQYHGGLQTRKFGQFSQNIYEKL